MRVVLSIDEAIGMKHYVIVMDEPVNSDRGWGGIGGKVCSDDRSPKRHIILVQANKVQDSVNVGE